MQSLPSIILLVLLVLAVIYFGFWKTVGAIVGSFFAVIFAIIAIVGIFIGGVLLLMWIFEKKG